MQGEASEKQNDPASRRKYEPGDFPKGDNQPFGTLYRELYPQYLGWARRRWRADEDLLAEVFNESLLIFRRKAWDGSLDSYRGKQLNTIVFSFASNLIRNRLRKDQRYRERFEVLEETTLPMESEMSFVVGKEMQEGIFAAPEEGKVALLKQALKGLTERCRTILTLRIVQGVSMPEIAQQLGLSSTNSAKTAKNKCLNRLKQLMGQTAAT